LEQAQAELEREREKHSKVQADFAVLEKEKARITALYEREKEKRRSMTAQIGKMRHLEMLLHDQQHLQAEIEKYQNRLKASDLYSVLSSSSGDVPLAKIDEYVKDSGDPDASKFLELVRRSVYPFYAFLQRIELQRPFHWSLSFQLNKHKNLNVALKEELELLRGNKSQTPYNPKLKNIIDYSPERRASLGFELDDSADMFLTSVIDSAYKARNKPTYRARLASAQTIQASGLIFDDEQPSTSKPKGGDEEDGEWSKMTDLSEVKVPEVVMRRAFMGSPKKKSNGMGGTTWKFPKPSAVPASKRPMQSTKSQQLKRIRPNAELSEKRISDFFKKSSRSVESSTLSLSDMTITIGLSIISL
uniref:RGS domain-containing protein n=1 Tax=Ascaris lumbricoides TaxID=6252 RepID=A0A9J2PQ08_ASCLU